MRHSPGCEESEHSTARRSRRWAGWLALGVTSTMRRTEYVAVRSRSRLAGSAGTDHDVFAQRAFAGWSHPQEGSTAAEEAAAASAWQARQADSALQLEVAFGGRSTLAGPSGRSATLADHGSRSGGGEGLGGGDGGVGG